MFVPTATLPSWPQVLVEVNPVSKIADAARDLLPGGPVAGPVTAALMVVVFARSRRSGRRQA